jgi:fructokinase
MSEQNKQPGTGQIALFGEVLMDKFPDGHQVLGGAPFNVAWHLQAFGLAPCFISRVGDDAMGENIRRAMADWGMAVDNVQIDPAYPTGTVKVTFTNGEPGYEILADQAYDFIVAPPRVSENPHGIIYHGTLAGRGRVSEQALNALKAGHGGKVFLDVNLRAPWWRKEQVEQWLGEADWVKLNHEELILLTPPQNTLREAMDLFMAQHAVDVLVVTCGGSGAMAMDKAGAFFEVAPAAGLAVVDTVGAGDAFSSVLLLGMRLDWPLPLTLDRAQAFASAMVGQRGATVQDSEFYRPFIRDWNLDQR